MLLIGGEDGIGKTRFAGELASRAARLGATTHVGCAFDNGCLPLEPWREVLGSIAAARAHAELVDVLEPPAAAFTETGRDRYFRVLQRASDALRQLAEEAPFVLVLDDLHHADRPTIDLLQFVARIATSAPMLLVATFRQTVVDATTPIATVVPRLLRDRGARRLELRGLSLDEIGELAGASARGDRSPRRELDLFERTAGNPFVLHHALEIEPDDLPLPPVFPNADDDSIPELARGVLVTRLRKIPEDCVALLECAAVLGGTFRVDLAASLAGIDGPTTTRLLTTAVDGAFILPPRADGRTQLAHPLITQVLYDRCGPRRAALHLEAAEALDRLGAPAVTLAWHLGRAGLQPGDRRELEQLVRGGADLLDRGDWHRATLLYERARTVLAEDEPSPADVHDVLLGLASAARQAGAEGVIAEFTEAWDAAQRTKDGRRLARTAIAMSDPGVAADDQLDALIEARAALAGGEEDLQDDDRRLLALVEVQLAEELAASDLDRADAFSRAAAAHARTLLDPMLLARALLARSSAQWRPDLAADQLATGDELRGLADDLHDQRLALAAHQTCLAARQQLGQMHAAQREIGIIDHLAADLHDPTARASCATARAMAALLQGRTADAARQIRDADHAADRLDHDDLRRSGLVQTLLLDWENGRGPAYDDRALGLPEGHELLAAWRCFLTFASCTPGREDGLRARFHGLGPAPLADAPRTSTWPACVALLAAIADFLDAVDEAPMLAELLEPFRPYSVTIGPMVSLGSASYFVGLAWRTAGEMDKARDALERAVNDNDAMGARPWSARSRIALGQLVEMVDADLARRLLQEAHDTAEALSLPRLLVESGRALAAARPALPDGLTPREAEILRGIAGGMTNADLADALYVSLKTVERHVTNLYRKVGVDDRVGASGYATARGLG